VAEKFGRLLHDRRRIFVGRLYWQKKWANFIDRLTAPLEAFSCIQSFIFFDSMQTLQASPTPEQASIANTTVWTVNPRLSFSAELNNQTS